MKTQNYQLKPQDIVLLLKLVVDNNPTWNQKPISAALCMSQSEISQAVSRCKFAGLLSPDGKTVMKNNLFDLLQYGIRFIFAQHPGPVVRGIPTSHSADPLRSEIQSDELFVWPYANGTARGHSIAPLYPSVPAAAMKDSALHEILALVDALRVGRSREKDLALIHLKERFDYGKQNH
jgi:hypothetical protein